MCVTVYIQTEQTVPVGRSSAPPIVVMLETVAGRTALRHSLPNHQTELFTLTGEMAGTAVPTGSVNSHTRDHNFDTG